MSQLFYVLHNAPVWLPHTWFYRINAHFRDHTWTKDQPRLKLELQQRAKDGGHIIWLHRLNTLRAGGKILYPVQPTTFSNIYQVMDLCSQVMKYGIGESKYGESWNLLHIPPSGITETFYIFILLWVCLQATMLEWTNSVTYCQIMYLTPS